MSQRDCNYIEELIRLHLPQEYDYKFISIDILQEPTLMKEISFESGRYKLKIKEK